MTDIQAALAIISTALTGMVSLFGFWARAALRQQTEHITDLNKRIATLEKREEARELRIQHLEAENTMLRFRLSRALSELSKTNPALAKVLGDTGEFNVGK